MRRLRITPAAQDDLLAVWSYIAQDKPVAADRFLRRLNDRINGLPKHPLIGQRQDRYREGLRSVVEGQYVIFYEVAGEFVSIYRVLHGTRDLDAILGDVES